MDNTVPIPGDDAEMNAAMDEARARLHEFRRALDGDARRVIPEIEGALVKAAVSSIATGKTEHVWIEDAGFEDDMIVGTVSSEHNQLRRATEPTTSISSSVTGRLTFAGFPIVWSVRPLGSSMTASRITRRSSTAMRTLRSSRSTILRSTCTSKRKRSGYTIRTRI